MSQFAVTPATRLAGLCVIGAAALIGATQQQTGQQDVAIKRVEQQSGTRVTLIAVSAPLDNVVWVAGRNGTFLKTTDGGDTWKAAQVPGAEQLEFRDVHAVDGEIAYLLSIGKGDKSRIYKTMDGGAHWETQFTNRDTAAFYDCFAFWDADHGVVVSDAVNGEMVIRTTADGKHWAQVPPSSLPQPLPNEGSFASSGTCVTAVRGGHGWIGTTRGRVFRTSDYGKSWKLAFSFITANDTTGVASVAFRDRNNGFAFGGYGGRPADTLVVETTNGGAAWNIRANPPIASGIWAGSFVPAALHQGAVVVVGARGSAYTLDHAKTWTVIDTANYWGLGFAPNGVGWAVGGAGRITRFSGF